MKAGFLPEADAEMIDSAQFYEHRQAGLGQKFLDAIEVAVRDIEEHADRLAGLVTQSSPSDSRAVSLWTFVPDNPLRDRHRCGDALASPSSLLDRAIKDAPIELLLRRIEQR